MIMYISDIFEFSDKFRFTMFIHLARFTMIEEKRVLMGRNASSSSRTALESSIGTSDSRTPRMNTFITELLR